MRNKENSFAFLNALHGSTSLAMDKKIWNRKLETLMDKTKSGHVINYSDPNEFEDVLRNSEWEIVDIPLAGSAALQTTGISGYSNILKLSELDPTDLVALLRINDKSAILAVDWTPAIQARTPIFNTFTVITKIEYDIEVIQLMFCGNYVDLEIVNIANIPPLTQITAQYAIGLGFTNVTIVDISDEDL